MNEFKKNPVILDEIFFDKSYFLDIVANDSIFDCFVLETVLLKSNLQIIFSSNVTISHLNHDQNKNRYELFIRVYKTLLNRKMNIILKYLLFNKDKSFDSSTSVKTLILQGTIYGDNYIRINDQLHKSLLLNQFVRHGRKLFL